MRVRTETPDLLVLDDRPLMIALLLLVFALLDLGVVMALASQGDWAGVGMLGLGLPMMAVAWYFFVRRTIVFLDRSTGLVTRRVAMLVGQTEERLPLSDVVGAETQSPTMSKGRSTYKPVLILRNGGRHPLLSVSTSGRGPSRAVAAINRWLAAGKGPG